MMTVHSVKYTTAFITALATSLQVGVVHHIIIIIEDIKTYPKSYQPAVGVVHHITIIIEDIKTHPKVKA